MKPRLSCLKNLPGKVSLFFLATMLAACSCRLPWQKEEPPAVAVSEAAPTPGDISAPGPGGDAAPGPDGDAASASGEASVFDKNEVPPYSDSPAVEVNGNTPLFTEEEIADALALAGEKRSDPLLSFAEPDGLERAGVAVAILSKADMATAERVPIPGIKPSGFVNAKYDWIDGNYVYNRCHLLGYQLTAENGDIRNLITGTRYLNIEGMLPYENRAASYLRRNPNANILYRVTPVFEGENLVASGVLMEARSLEDGGRGLCFCVYCYNVQPGVIIDYSTGITQAEQ